MEGFNNKMKRGSTAFGFLPEEGVLWFLGFIGFKVLRFIYDCNASAIASTCASAYASTIASAIALGSASAYASAKFALAFLNESPIFRTVSFIEIRLQVY